MAERMHIRVHETGKYVRTFCGKVMPRSLTHAFRRNPLPSGANPDGSLRLATATGCPGCLFVGERYAASMAKTPATLRRVTNFVRANGGWPKQPEPTPLEMIEAAQLEAARVGDMINAKFYSAEKAVRVSAAAVARLKRKLNATTTFLKKAEQRLVRAEKKLAKTPKYEPPPSQEEGTDHASSTRATEV